MTRLVDRLIVAVERWYRRRRQMAWQRVAGGVPEQVVYVETEPRDSTRTFAVARDANGRALRVAA